MGVDTSAVLIVGRPYEDFDAETLGQLIDDDDIQSASPHYDADRKYCIFGIVVAEADNEGVELKEPFENDVLKAKAEFAKLTGLEGKLYLSPNVW